MVIGIDENGLTITNADGTPETSVVTHLSTRVVNVTDSNGKVVTQKNGNLVTSVVTSPTIPNKTSTIRRTTEKTDPAISTTTTTKKLTTTTTTKKPTTKNTTTTKKPITTTTTKKGSGDPWVYPYDVNQIYKDAKDYALSIDLEWDDTLTKDNCFWITPNSTVPWSLGQMPMTFKSKTLEEINEYKEMGFTVCKLYMEPDAEDIGDYWVYYLLG